ncbi:MAG: tetraacyldisaccharide 4'-kinase [Pseudomonadota bacterium]
MMREPWFWRSHSMTAKVISTVLAPATALYDLGQQVRWRLTTPATPAIPVICVGNASLGGVGKTPFAIALFEMLSETGLSCQFLTRGYGGSEPGPAKVDISKHSHEHVGDEALLLAQHGPVWVSRERVAGAHAAINDGAEVIIMDDGFQNPTINKTISILLLDAEDPDGNGRLFPAGPLREPVARARDRADVTITVGPDPETAQSAAQQIGSPFAAWLEPVDTPETRTVVAFSGIGKPDKFFTSLRRDGFKIVEAVSFPDHHPFTDRNLVALKKIAAKANATLMTTEKDFVRLPSPFRDEVLTYPVRMRVNASEAMMDLIRSAIDAARDDR